MHDDQNDDEAFHGSFPASRATASPRPSMCKNRHVLHPDVRGN